MGAAGVAGAGAAVSGDAAGGADAGAGVAGAALASESLDASAIATALIKHTGDKAMPGAWLSAAAVIGLAATVMARADRDSTS